MTKHTPWSMHMGATVTADGTHFAVWAPKARRVEVVFEDGSMLESVRLEPDEHSVYSGTAPGVGSGARYKYRLDGEGAYPDPYSRYQPGGPHGPSEVIDPSGFAWSDGAWPGLSSAGLVVYELHVGTMTAAGTYDALRRELAELQRLGVTAIELMPLADAPGRRNWGYDGVNLFAPKHNYGRPDDLKRLIDAAHQVGIGVLIDVVYNHFGPDGNYLRAFSDDYFTARDQTPWGDGLNYDGPNARFMRQMVIDNACYWLNELHADGLRLDAIDAIVDDSSPHILAELTAAARAATPRPIVLIAEQAANDARIIQPVTVGGLGMDAAWADDFHHALRVLLTGQREGYFADYHGTTTELKRAIETGFLLQRGAGPGGRYGTKVTVEPATAFVFCTENHDQVGNRAFGERLNHLVSPGQYAAASALLLFAPETPLLFMGQEFAASSPFLFFTDHNEELGKLVVAGRRQEFKRFPAFADPEQRERIPNPQADETFLRSKLNLAERATHRGIYRLYRDLLRLRRDDPVLRDQAWERTTVAPLGAQALAVRRWRDNQQRLLIANFGDQPLPLPATGSASGGWSLAGARAVLATNWKRYGGPGASIRWTGRDADRHCMIPAESAIVFATTTASDRQG